MGGDTSSVGSFFDRSSDATTGKPVVSGPQIPPLVSQWWRCEMSAVFSGYVRIYSVRDIYILTYNLHVT